MTVPNPISLSLNSQDQWEPSPLQYIFLNANLLDHSTNDEQNLFYYESPVPPAELSRDTDVPRLYQATNETSLVSDESPGMKNHPKNSSVRVFKCKLCDARFSTSRLLVKHKRLKHDEDRLHKCDICTYECIELAKLSRHKRMHAGFRPFKCPSCVYQSYDKSKIRRHNVTHTREKPFMCGFCGSCFTQSGSLKTHLINVHDLVKVEFRCASCDRLPATTNMGELRNHMKTIHRFSCYPVIVNEENLVLNSPQVSHDQDLSSTSEK